MDNVTLLQSIILGIVQGLTEFLPVSSSGHLVLVPAILGWPAPGLAFDALLHWGTLAAVVGYFFHDLWIVIRDWLTTVFMRRPATPGSRLAWMLVIGTVPAVIIGLLFDDFVEQLFASPLWVGVFLLVTAALLTISERLGKHGKEVSELSVWDALIIGAAQGLAIAPGLSRSGATIAVGLFLGLRRPAAARFSFLLSVPVILGAGALKLLDLLEGNLGAQSWLILFIGFVAAAIAGYLCIRFFLRYLQRGKLYIFAGYCLLVGLAVIAASALGYL